MNNVKNDKENEQSEYTNHEEEVGLLPAAIVHLHVFNLGPPVVFLSCLFSPFLITFNIWFCVNA